MQAGLLILRSEVGSSVWRTFVQLEVVYIAVDAEAPLSPQHRNVAL
jgi:hypothetical protein